jgi:hypothetical protein
MKNDGCIRILALAAPVGALYVLSFVNVGLVAEVALGVILALAAWARVWSVLAG